MRVQDSAALALLQYMIVLHRGSSGMQVLIAWGCMVHYGFSRVSGCLVDRGDTAFGPGRIQLQMVDELPSFARNPCRSYFRTHNQQSRMRWLRWTESGGSGAVWQQFIGYRGRAPFLCPFYLRGRNLAHHFTVSQYTFAICPLSIRSI